MITRGDRDENAVSALVERFTTLIGDQGGTVDNVDHWGKRQFAYEIQHMTEGYYTVIDFTIATPGLNELDRQLGITDDVVRHKIIRPALRKRNLRQTPRARRAAASS